MESSMILKCGFRRIGLPALLIAMMVQGLTPGTYTVVSPWALRWLDRCATAESSEAGFGRMPGDDDASPSEPSDHHGAPDEAVTPGQLHVPPLLVRYPILPPSGHVCADDRPDTPSPAGLPDTASPAGDPMASLCRMIC